MKTENLIKLKKNLVEGGFITKEQLQQAETEAKNKSMLLEDIIVEKDFLTDENLGRLIADNNNWQFISLKKENVDKNLLNLIPEEVARKQLVIVFAKNENGVKVAMNDPDNITLIHLLEKRLGKNVIPYFATKMDIADNFSLYKKNIKEEFQNIIKTQAKKASKGEQQDSATVQIVDAILTRGYESGASDIHIEPYENNSLIRFRIDGVMHDIINIPKSIHNLLISRIKVMGRLRTDEHQIPQDGKIEYYHNKKRTDIRVSIVPTTKGENAVMRLLSEKSRQYSLSDLGLSDKDLYKLEKAIKKPWGMILSTGPTGSGKTTSLYTILKILNKKSVNITTIEDPVEYNIDGITQIQVNSKAQLTFASGLRSIVRQDPDIIMVGEIRDRETADIAVNSAMTGHLVLSTLHTNDASTTLPRILDMGIEPFLLASTLNVAIGQRLVRKICPKCIKSYVTDLNELADYMPISVLEKLAQGSDHIRIFKGAGCGLCNNTGYHGRTGVYEILEIDDDIRKLIMENAEADKIKEKAIENGMTTMFDNAREKVLSGITTIEEMIRVIKE